MLLHCLGSERRSGKVWRVFWGGEEIEEKERKETKKAALQRSNIYIYIYIRYNKLCVWVALASHVCPPTLPE